MGFIAGRRSVCLTNLLIKFLTHHNHIKYCLNVQVFTDQKCFCAGIGGSLLLWLLPTKLPLLPADEQDKEEKEPLEDEFFFEMVALISKPPP